MDDVARAMPLDAPFQLGPFLIRPDGRIALASPGVPPRFHLHWRGCRVDARLRPVGASRAGAGSGGDGSCGGGSGGEGPSGDGAAGGDLGELCLHATVGRVPSTARLGAPAAASGRAAVFAALRSLPAALPAGWHADLLADHRVALVSASKVAMPTTVSSLLTDVTLFLLALGPYLDLLGELGVEAPADAAAPAASAVAGAPGMAKICPG